MAALGQSEQATDTGLVDAIPVLGRFQVSTSARLPHLDTPTAEAFAAEDGKDQGNVVYALVCGDDLPPRLAELEKLTGVNLPALMTPSAWAVVFWPPDNAERFVILFPQPVGERVMKAGEPRFAPMKEEQLVRAVIRPLFPVLADLGRKGLTHRAIRADNLFFADPAGLTVKLGECVTAPPGFGQPVIYETIERGMTSPIGRGTGTPKDDLYAFGVLLMVLILGHDLCEEFEERDIIDAKIGTGSYAALLGRERIPIPLLEPLRGLLCDNPDDRWTIEDLERWLEGRAMTPKQVMLPTKAQRSFGFSDGDYWNLRTLANAMAGDWTNALSLIQGKELVQWVQRSLSGDLQAPIVEHTFYSVQDSSRASHTKDQMLFRILLALDPEGPFRYKDLACSVDALGTTLAASFDDPDARGLFRDAFLNKLPQLWLEAQPKSRREHGPLKRTFNRLNNFVTRKGPAFGLERCLYYLNPGWPCRSPVIKGKLVYDLEGLLPALETIAQQGAGELEPVDSHIAAFCAANMRFVPDGVVKGLADETDPQTRRLAMLGLLAEVQDTVGPDDLPALAGWFVELLKPSIEAIHSVPYRNALQQELDRTVATGSLKGLLTLVHNEPALQRDTIGFSQARALYQQAESEIAWLEAGGMTNEANVTRGSEQTSVLVSAVLSGFALVVITLVQVL